MKTAYYIQKELERRYGINPFTEPATSYYGLLTAALVELSGNGYARKDIVNNGSNFSFSTDHVNNPVIAFAAASGGNWSPIYAVARFDAASAGNQLQWEWMHDLLVAGTAAAATDTLTSYAHGLVDGDEIVFRSPDGGTLPTGISAETVYHVRDATTNTFKVAATAGGAAIDLTADGEFLGLRVKPQTVTDGNVFQLPAAQMPDYER